MRTIRPNSVQIYMAEGEPAYSHSNNADVGRRPSLGIAWARNDRVRFECDGLFRIGFGRRFRHNTVDLYLGFEAVGEALDDLEGLSMVGVDTGLAGPEADTLPEHPRLPTFLEARVCHVDHTCTLVMDGTLASGAYKDAPITLARVQPRPEWPKARARHGGMTENELAISIYLPYLNVTGTPNRARLRDVANDEWLHPYALRLETGTRCASQLMSTMKALYENEGGSRQ